MENEQNNNSEVISNGSTLVDLGEVTEQLEQLNEAMRPEVVEVNGVEKNEIQLLLEILEEVTPSEELLELQRTETETQLETLQLLNDNLVLLAATLDTQHIEILEQMEEQQTMQVEGDFMVTLAIVTSFGIYMFWNQMSKW